MPKRTVCIQNPCRLSEAHGSLILEGEGRHAEVPFEDIWVLILETRQAVCTTSLLSALAEAGVGVVTCGSNHMPNGLHLPLGSHFRHAGVVEHQLAMSKPLKKRLWQRLTRAKIENQAACLDLLGDAAGAEVLRDMARSVLSGDSTGRESVAAAYYFKRLLPRGTRREGPYAAPLDYGYAVLRAGIARTAVAGGWLVSRGIHHECEHNAFNLVDDLIEPYRPLVDLMVRSVEAPRSLTPEYRAYLAGVFEHRVSMPTGTHILQSAMEEQMDSFKRAVLASDASLFSQPRLLPLRTGRAE